MRLRISTTSPDYILQVRQALNGLAMINGVVDPYDIDWLDKFEMLGFCEVPVSAMWAPLDFSNVDDEFSGLGIPLLIPDGEGYKVVECGIS